jgi:hypothetical protein
VIDEQLDERLRAAFDEVRLPPETVRRLVRQAERRPRARLSGVVVLLAAAAVLALLAWPIVRAWWQPAPVPEPAPATSPVPLPPLQAVPAPTPTPAPSVQDAHPPLSVDALAERDRLLQDYRNGDRMTQLKAMSRLKRLYGHDPAVIAALGLPDDARGANERAQAASPPPRPAVAPDPDVRGLWVGSTSFGRSFKLTVLGQGGSDFEGTVELQLAQGDFASFAVQGTVDAVGAMSMSGAGYSMTAVVNGRRASGSYTAPDGARAYWTAVH